MENTIAIALSRQTALTRRMEVTANNLANMNTAGYRAEQVMFQEFLERPNTPDPTGTGEISMVIDQGLMRDIRPGAIVHTGNSLDVAIQGNGYLMVQTPTGPRYTRAGHLAIDLEHRLVDASGLPLIGEGDQPITLPPDAGEVTINGSGEVSVLLGAATGGGAPTTSQVGRLRLVEFENQQEPNALGGGLYVSNQTPQTAQNTELLQGMIEQSNVQPIAEVTNMIDISRQYQATQKLLDDEHERLKSAIRRLGQSSRAV